MVVCVALLKVKGWTVNDVMFLFSFGKTPKSKKSLSLSDIVKPPSADARMKATGVADTLKSSQSDHNDDNKIL